MDNQIRVLIVDDHPIVRRGLHSLLDFTPGMVVAGEASDGVEAVNRVKELTLDVVLLDLVMPNKNGLEVISEIIAIAPQIKILVLTSFEEDERILAALQAGALGCVLKDSDPDILIKAIRDVHEGFTFLHPGLASKLFRNIHKYEKDKPAPLVSILTDREMDVLKLITQGYPNKEVALKLNVTEGTIRSHISNILGKLQLSNRTQAVIYAIREGIALIPEKK